MPTTPKKSTSARTAVKAPKLPPMPPRLGMTDEEFSLFGEMCRATYTRCASDLPDNMKRKDVVEFVFDADYLAQQQPIGNSKRAIWPDLYKRIRPLISKYYFTKELQEMMKQVFPHAVYGL